MKIIEWKKEMQDAKIKVAKALEGLDDRQCYHILNTYFYYGWKRPNGKWHKSVYERG